MKNLLLVDGNSMVFRAFYATIYTRPMKTSFNQPTNAVFGFANMVNKALDILRPDAVLFAFDSKAKTFRHNRYDAYKGTRKELPQELIDQFQLVRDYLDASNFSRYEIEGYEADDIIGTVAKMYPDVMVTILTSDRDLLQLIDKTTRVLLMKKGISEMEEVDETVLLDQYHLKPSQIIDLKSLMGDASDNIPGVPKVGEKTAMKLLEEYGTLENLLEHTSDLKGKLRENIENNIELAKLSKELATIYTEVPIDFKLDDLWHQPNFEGMIKFFRQYELRQQENMVQELFMSHKEESSKADVFFDASWIKDDLFVLPYKPTFKGYGATCEGFILADEKSYCYVQLNEINNEFKKLFKEKRKNAFDIKLIYHLADTLDLSAEHFEDDLMLLAFINDTKLTSLDKVKDEWGITNLKENEIESAGKFAMMAFEKVASLKKELQDKEMLSLYQDMERPLIETLYRMEKEGISVDEKVFDEIAIKTKEKIDRLTQEIQEFAGKEFNINSPKQLGEVLFDDLGLQAGSKRSTSADVLESLAGKHPIIEPILEYRKYQKLYSTYAEGLKKFVLDDSKIHTVFNQCATQTGRLSATDPNMQNISVRQEETREIRKAFVAKEWYVLLGADYSQIELRVLAHMAKEETMIDAFNHQFDIHTQTAMDVFGVEASEVTSLMRRSAKAVNFGIIYGISDFGLSAQLNISRKEASKFIETYLATYPKIQMYMDETVHFAQNHGYVTTLFHRRRQIDELFDKVYSVREFGKRAAMNAPIQGSAADLIKLAMLEVEKAIEATSAKLILQVHDELVFEVKEDEAEKVAQMVVDAMSQVVQLDVPLEVSYAIGKNWYEAK